MRAICPAIAATAIFLTLAALNWVGARGVYDAVITGWGVAPYNFPFLDTDTVLSALRCARIGIDVYVTNPCDVLGRVYDYSPLWLALRVFSVTTAWITPVGFGVDIIFLLSLFLLPPGRDWRDSAIITAGALSSSAVFAMERGNNDLIIFGLAAGAAALACRSRALRLFGYSLALLAGLLKYYPMTLMILATRERPRVFFTVAAVATACVVGFVVLERADLARALALIPTGSPFSHMFGAKTLPLGLRQVLNLPPSPGVVAICELLMILPAFAVGITFGRRAGTSAGLAALTQAERAFLLTGALLILSCFLTAQNIGYRAIHLIMVLPGLLALRRVAPRPFAYTGSIVIVIILLWAEGWDTWIWLGLPEVGFSPSQVNRVLFVAWVMREVAWWWVVILAVTLVTGLTLGSEMGGVFRGWLFRDKASAKAPRLWAVSDRGV
jgi:hypothetical protein